MLFTVLVYADGYVPKWTANLDPKKEPSRTVLVKHDLDTREPERILQGRVVDERGEPIAGAVIEPTMVFKGTSGTSDTRGIDPLAVTNAKGEFRLGVTEAGMELWVKASAPDKASRKFLKLQVSAKQHILTLQDGVSVRVRILKDGQPLAGVGVGIVQSDRGIEHFLGHHELATNASGTVTFQHLPANEPLFVYGIMRTLRAHGAIDVKEIRTGASGSKLDLGDLNVVPGFRLQGQVILSDGKSVPPNTRVLLARENAWDSETATIDEQGQFRFDAVSRELIGLSVRIPGYYLSPQNVSYDPLRRNQVFGVMNADIEDYTLTFLPGELPQNPMTMQRDMDIHQGLKSTQLNSVISVASSIASPNGTAPTTRAGIATHNVERFIRSLTWRDYIAAAVMVLLFGWLLSRLKFPSTRTED